MVPPLQILKILTSAQVKASGLWNAGRFVAWAVQNTKMTRIALKCNILHYPQILYPCQTKRGLFFLVLEKIIRSDAIYHIKL